MNVLVLGMVVFFGIHLALAFAPALRVRLVRGLGGERHYRRCFALVAVAGLLLMIWGKVMAGHIPLWQPPSWGARAALWLMLPSMVLLASLMGSNLKHLVRHPMLCGVTLWATAHLLANGDLGSLLLFGGFLAYALFAICSLTRRGAVSRQRAPRKMPFSRDVSAVALGVIVFGVVGILHPYLFGVPAF